MRKLYRDLITFAISKQGDDFTSKRVSIIFGKGSKRVFLKKKITYKDVEYSIYFAPYSIVPKGQKPEVIFHSDGYQIEPSVAFGKFVPFISKGVVKHSTFYAQTPLNENIEALNRAYLDKIVITNLRDETPNDKEDNSNG